MQLLHKSSARSPESGLFSDWLLNKSPFLIGYVTGYVTSGATSNTKPGGHGDKCTCIQQIFSPGA